MSAVSRVAILVDTGASLRKQIAELEALLEKVEEELIEHAKKGDQIPLVDEDREGKQFLAQGTDILVPVVFTADKLIATFQNNSAAHFKIHKAIGAHTGHFRKFYLAKTVWEMTPKDGKAFRALAGELLGKDAPAFITACKSLDKHGIPKSDIKIEWEKAKETP
jgi:hypothetical protein